MIKLHNVCFSYGEVQVLKDLNYTFPDSGIFAIMGASGVGKSTLLRVLCGLEKPTAGTVESTHRKVAFAFQEPRLLPWLNCEENINFVLNDKKQDFDITQTLLRDLALEAYAKSLPNALSGGMKQRLSLARALAVGADLLLLDEPFSALDNSLKERVAPLIQAANPSGLTLVVTHDRRDAALLGATVLELTSSSLHIAQE